MTATSPLLVPVAVEAMVHNSPATNFVRAGMDYRQLAGWRAPEPAAFQNDATDFATNPRHQGVYLMWTLPEALRRGAQQADGSYRFPFVPDRWLVVRHYWPTAPSGGAAPSAPEVAAWVVQSDFLDPTSGTSPYLDPAAAKPTPTAIGRKIAIDATTPWIEPGPPTKPFLTAVAESCPAFAAYQPFNENVFSIFDDLAIGADPTQKLAGGTLSYFVMGWYVDPETDLLADAPADPAQFATLLTSLGLAASPPPGGVSSSLYHGGANGIAWNPGGAAPSSPSDGAMPQVAIGSTSIDGVTAFARAALKDAPLPDGTTADQAAALIEAFQYGVLDKLGLFGADAIVEQEIRARWHQSSDGGTHWAIVGAPTPPGVAAKPPPPLSVDEVAWLDSLNAAQQAFDDAARKLIGTRQKLYEMWWKWGAAKLLVAQSGGVTWPWNTSDAQFQQAVTALSQEAQTAIATAQAKLASIPHAAGGVTLASAAADFAQQKGLRPELALKPVAEPRYWMPVDPVAVISNTAHLLKIEPDARLGCRWPEEIVTAIAAGSTPVSTSAMTALLPSLPWQGLPEPGAALYAESFLLDPAAANAASAAAGSPVTAGAIAEATASTGALPGLRQAWPWTQAWRPLFLDWMVEWFQIPFLRSDGAPNWTFDGLDYDLVENYTAAPVAAEFAGRAILSPKPSFEFKSRLDQFLKDYGDNPEAPALSEIETLLQTADSWDFLSQTMGGLNTQLAKRNPVGSANPDATVAALIGRAVGPPPHPHLSAAGRGPAPASTFEALRAGQFFVNRLTVVDAFGQTIEAVRAPIPPDTLPRTDKNLVFHPLLDDGVAPTRPLSPLEPERFVQLPPRLLQPVRLNFRFEPGATRTAISGWVIPNHLDGSLMAYDAGGAPLGSLARGVDASGAAELVWAGGPGSPYPDGPEGFAKMVADHDRLGAMLGRLFSAGPDTFLLMLRTIDETLWSVDPLGARADAFLSVLVGRPLAVVAASLSLELQAPALRDPDWPYTFEPPDPAILRYKFPVRLGDLGYHQDGLIGYFTDGDYDQFNALHVPDGPTPPYLKAVASGNFIDLGLADDGPGPAADLTLLVDPRASVHAQCALVPMKAVTLPPDWVDGALAAMSVSFEAGPRLVETRAVPVGGASPDAQTLVMSTPAERQGRWSWMERDAGANWTERPLTAADEKPVFTEVRPTLRDGMFRLDSALGEP
jgi:hypothetical protein